MLFVDRYKATTMCWVVTLKYGFVAGPATGFEANGDVKPPEAEEDIDERPTTPPDGEQEFTDDDGTTYKWDRGLRAWVPQVGIFDNVLYFLSGFF